MIEYVLDKLEEFVRGRGEMKNQRRQIADDALRAVGIALNETEIYYARLQRGAARSEETELQLSRYWAAASVPLRHVDLNLADTCEHKSRYWLDPTTWDEAKIKKFKIRLTSVARKVRQLRRVHIMAGTIRRRAGRDAA